MYSRALARVYVYPLDADCFQPGFHVFRKKVFFRVPRVHRVPCISRASCFHIHQNISACIYVHPRASTRIREGAVLEESMKSKITLISVTICTFSICDRRYLNVRDSHLKSGTGGQRGFGGYEIRKQGLIIPSDPPYLIFYVFSLTG